MSKRIVFSFDQRSFDSLQLFTERGGYSSMAAAVRDSLQITRALRLQMEQGFTEIVVRNPKSGMERVLIIPELNGK